MYSLHVYGIDHTRAPLALREVLAFSPEQQSALLPALIAEPAPGTQEVMVLSTCNRTEFYLVRDENATSYPLANLLGFRPEAAAIIDTTIRYHLAGRDAIHHLFAVAASLRSQLPGETQIASQLAEALAIARQAGTTGPYLERITAWALHAAKCIRRETGIAAGKGGLGPAVLRTIRKQVVGHGRPVSILMLGAGRAAEEVLAHLVRSGAPSGSRSPGISVRAIWSRDVKKAAQLSERIGSQPVGPAEALRCLASVDVAVGACRGRVPLLNKEIVTPLLESRTRPLLFLDLGVPRNLDPDVAASDALQMVSLDDLQSQMRRHNGHMAAALRRADEMVSESSESCMRWWETRNLHGMRGELFAAVESVLANWRQREPGHVKHLRPVLHRSLAASFQHAMLSLS